SESDRKTLATYLQNAENAANQRKNARSEFQMGETAMQKNAPAEALTHYKAAANSKYVDSGTREKALEKAAMAQSSLRNSDVSLKDLYAQAKADYDAGNMQSARTKFTQLQASGFKAPLFQRDPGDYLKDIDKKIGA